MKFGIDLGHGVGPDRGASGNIAEEAIINAVGVLVISKLKALGHTVIELRPISASSVEDSLEQRYNRANYYNVNMCISIHANAGGGIGTEVYTYKAKEVKEARTALNNICSLGFRNRGIKDGSHLAMVRAPKMTAMLIECCFVDSSDSDKYTSVGPEKIANAIVSGLIGQTVSTKYKIGWNADSNHNYWYSTNGNDYYTNGFQKIEGEWFYFDEKGYLKNGWIENNKKWYYMNTKHDGHFGALLAGWIEDKQDWYYGNQNHDGNYGMIMSGWIEYKGKKCYLEEKHNGHFGRCYCNETATINGKEYIFDKDGYLIE